MRASLKIWKGVGLGVKDLEYDSSPIYKAMCFPIL